MGSVKDPVTGCSSKIIDRPGNDAKPSIQFDYTCQGAWSRAAPARQFILLLLDPPQTRLARYVLCFPPPERLAVMQSYPHHHHQQFAPPPINSDYNSYDIAQSDESNVAVSQSSPVIHNYGPYPQSCIPTHTPMHPSVPNSEASFPNQAPPTPAAYGNQIPPGQPWARPMPEQVQPNPVPAQQYQAHHRRRSSHTSQEYTQNVHRRASIPHPQPPSYENGYSDPNHGYAPTAPVAQFQPQQQGYVPPPTHVHAYHQHQAPVANTFVPNNYQRAPVQYQNTVPPANEPTYGTYAPQGHVGQ
ncbi:hypothetical protein FRC09_008381, partial [Ceratobasidium sp. 395]